MLSRKDSKFYPEFILVVILLADLFFQALPVLPLVGLILLMHLFRLDYTSNSVLLFFFVPTFVGFVFRSIGISGIGGAIMVLGFLMMLFGIISGFLRLRYCAGGLAMLLLLFAVMFVSMRMSSGGDTAGLKFANTVKSGLSSFIAFSVLFSNFGRANVKGLGVYVIVYAAFLLRLSLFTDGIEGPESFMDFGFIRRAVVEDMHDEVFFVNYQFPGFFFLQGISLFLMSGAFRRREVYKWFAAGLLFVLYAGARQMVVVIFAVMAFWVIRSYSHKGIWQLTLLLLLATALYLGTSVGEMFETVTEEGYIEGSGRGPQLLRGVELFLGNKATGVGFGRYNYMGDYDTYPHNLFVEILCEMGIAGLLVFIGVTVAALLRAKRSVGMISYYLLAVFLFAMASGAMYDNIIIFTLLFAAKSLYKPRTVEKYSSCHSALPHPVFRQ